MMRWVTFMRGIGTKPAYGLILKIGEVSYGEGFDRDVKKPALKKAGFYIWWVVSDSNARPTD